MSKKKFEFILSVKEKGFSTFKTAQSGMAAFNKEVKLGNKGLAGLTTQLGLVTGGMLGFAGVMAAGFGISQLVANVVEGEKQLGNFARTAGMSVGNFQAYAYGVQTMGLEQDKLADISKDVFDKIGDYVETGGGEFADFFENVADKVGLSAEALLKMSGPDALIAVKKALDDANVPLKNQIFYLEAIANDASVLIPLLENEGKAWKELAAQAETMGIAISDLDHAQLMELNKVLKEVRTNLGITKREIVLALAPAIRDMAEYFADNTDELRDFVVGLAEGTGEVMKFVFNNKDLIITLGKVVLGVGLLSTGISATTTIIRGMNAATLAMTGMKVVPWLASFATGLKGVQIASLGTAAGIGAAAGATLAFVGGYAIGKKIDEWQYFSSVVGANKDALAEVPEKFREISEATGVAIRSFDDLNDAQEKGIIKFDDVTGEWVKGAGKMAEVVTKSATTQEKVTKSKLEEMKKAYKKYADEVAKLQEDIAGREVSLAEQLREMDRSTMSGRGAWQDRKKQAEEFAATAKKAEEAARAAFAAGDKETGSANFEAAVAFYDKAREAAADLNTEVRNGNKVIQTQKESLEKARPMVEEYGRAGVKTQLAYQAAIAEAGKALDEQTGGALSEDLPDIAQAFDDIAGATDDLTDKNHIYIKSIGATSKSWETAFKKMESDGSSAVSELLRKFLLLEKDRHVKVYVQEVVQKAMGGLASMGVAGFAAGGSPAQMFRRLSNPYITRGSGVKDDVPALLKKFEFVQPDTSVFYYGLDVMEKLRRRLIPRELIRQFADGGTPAGAVALGGGSGSAPVLGTYVLEAPIPSQQPARLYGSKDNVERFLSALQLKNKRRA